MSDNPRSLLKRYAEELLRARSAKHPRLTMALKELGKTSLGKQLLGEAEKYFWSKANLRDQQFWLDPDSAPITLSSLGEWLEGLGFGDFSDLRKAAMQTRDDGAIDIARPLDAADLNKISLIYISRGLYRYAMPLCLLALRTSEKAMGPNSPETANGLANLGLLHASQGHRGQAEQFLRCALDIADDALGNLHPSWAGIVSTIALAYSRKRQYGQAAHYCRQALGACQQALGPNHPDTAKCLQNLGQLYLSQNDLPIALSSLEASYRSELNWFLKEAPLLSNGSRRRLSGIRTGLSLVPLDLIASDQRFASLLFFLRLNRHGLLQQIEQRQAQVAQVPGEHRALVQRLKSVVSVLASSNVDPRRRLALSEEHDELEAHLYRMLPDLRMKIAEIDEVAEALPIDAALIECQRCMLRIDTKSSTRPSPHYLAFILLPNGEIDVIDLGLAPSLETSIREAAASTAYCLADAGDSWLEVSELIVKPLFSRLDGCKRWLLSLDGELHRVPFNVLSLPDHAGRLLAETVQIELVTSGRDLLDQHPFTNHSSTAGPALVLADPAFDPLSGLPTQESVSSRSRDMDWLKLWPPLPGTGREGKQVAELLGAELLTGEQATTFAVQQAERPNILHIATHGFFLPEQEMQEDEQPWQLLGGPALLANFLGEDPLLRSGLVFAGANYPVESPERDDGYLTALEAVHLNLQGTELVTLSACDAGRGDIHTGEGVYGLQRALIVAGARSLLLSLWQVPDEATCAFMVHFYTLLKQGIGRFDALVMVQREFREHDNIVWRHPFYWAAWQLVGDGGPIEGL